MSRRRVREESDELLYILARSLVMVRNRLPAQAAKRNEKRRERRETLWLYRTARELGRENGKKRKTISLTRLRTAVRRDKAGDFQRAPLCIKWRRGILAAGRLYRLFGNRLSLVYFDSRPGKINFGLLRPSHPPTPPPLDAPRIRSRDFHAVLARN